ncbi:MAG: bifunctional nuclease family protein [Thermodesulfobacteriota bacterium]
MMRKMEVTGLAMDPAGNTPILLLKSEEGDITLPIWIGLLEAASIAMALQNVEFARPMTHDLFKAFLDRMDVGVEKVEVVDLKDNTYFALIHFLGSDGGFTMDARPSDAIAIALRTKSPIFVHQEVIAKSTQNLEAMVEAADDSEEGKRWADYLAGLDPDAFGKYKM